MEIIYIWKMIRKIQRICLWHFHACLRKLTSLFRMKHDSGKFDNRFGVGIWCSLNSTSIKNPLFIPIQSRTTTIQLLHAAVVEPLSSAWPVIATVNRWNPLAWVGVVWALMCLLIHACLSCLLLLRVESGLIHREWIGIVMNMSYCVWAKCVNMIW